VASTRAMTKKMQDKLDGMPGVSLSHLRLLYKPRTALLGPWSISVAHQRIWLRHLCHGCPHAEPCQTPYHGYRCQGRNMRGCKARNKLPPPYQKNTLQDSDRSTDRATAFRRSLVAYLTHRQKIWHCLLGRHRAYYGPEGAVHAG
jgi:hypothetical protein